MCELLCKLLRQLCQLYLPTGRNSAQETEVVTSLALIHNVFVIIPLCAFLKIIALFEISFQFLALFNAGICNLLTLILFLCSFHLKSI